MTLINLNKPLAKWLLTRNPTLRKKEQDKETTIAPFRMLCWPTHRVFGHNVSGLFSTYWNTAGWGWLPCDPSSTNPTTKEVHLRCLRGNWKIRTIIEDVLQYSHDWVYLCHIHDDIHFKSWVSFFCPKLKKPWNSYTNTFRVYHMYVYYI